MPESVREFFEGLPSRVDPAKTAGMTTSYRFDVDGAGTWTVRVDDGKVTVNEAAEEAECTVRVTEDNFMKLLSRELNPTTAYMTGKVKIQGDMGTAMKLQKLF